MVFRPLREAEYHAALQSQSIYYSIGNAKRDLPVHSIPAGLFLLQLQNSLIPNLCYAPEIRRSRDCKPNHPHSAKLILHPWPGCGYFWVTPSAN